MEIGVKDLARFHSIKFRADGLLDFNHHICFTPDVVGVIQDFCTCLNIFLIPEAGAQACSFFHEYLVVVINEGLYSGRGCGHSLLSRFDFSWDA